MGQEFDQIESEIDRLHERARCLLDDGAVDLATWFTLRLTEFQIRAQLAFVRALDALVMTEEASR